MVALSTRRTDPAIRDGHVRVGINGFGRIGRAFFRAATHSPVIEVAAINDLQPDEHLRSLLKYDSIYRHHRRPTFHIGNVSIFHEADPKALPWERLGIDVIVESTRPRTDRRAAAAHLAAGAKWVLMCNPTARADVTILVGVNQHLLEPRRHRIIAPASCPLNCLGTLIQVLNQEFEISGGHATTVHAYTNNQATLDNGRHSDRFRRSGGLNIVPGSDPGFQRIEEIFPTLGRYLTSTTFRVPVGVGCLVDLTVELRKTVSANAIDHAFRSASAGRLRGILSVADEPIVSTDVRGAYESCLYDPGLTLTNEKMVKVCGWFDNETSYAARLVDLCELLTASIEGQIPTSRQQEGARPATAIRPMIVVLDVDGTLYPAACGLTDEINKRTVAIVEEVAGVDTYVAQSLFEKYGRDFGLAVVGLNAHFGADVGGLLERIHDVPYHKYLERNDPLRTLLRRLPVPKIAFSNAPRRHVLRVIRSLGVANEISAIVAFEDLFPSIKPAPDSFSVLARAAGARERDLILFDDNPHVAEAAERLGITAYLVGSDRRADVPGILRFVSLETAIVSVLADVLTTDPKRSAEKGQSDDC